MSQETAIEVYGWIMIALFGSPVVMMLVVELIRWYRSRQRDKRIAAARKHR